MDIQAQQTVLNTLLQLQQENCREGQQVYLRVQVAEEPLPANEKDVDQQHDADGSHVDVEAQSSLVVDSGNFLQTEYHPNLSGYVSSEQGMIHEVLIFFCTKFIFLFVMAMCHKNFCHSFLSFFYLSGSLIKRQKKVSLSE